jgi:hypothetical protein
VGGDEFPEASLLDSADASKLNAGGWPVLVWGGFGSGK